jgi:hypothetical protein
MSVTTWTRIEPDILTGDPQKDLTLGIAAELADPLWLLGRQWQMGEWQGEDAGSPVSAQVSASSYAIDSLAIGPQTVAYQPTATPSDTLVEHDGSPADLPMRASGGRAFLDTLADNKLSTYLAAAKSAFAFASHAGATVLERTLAAASGVDGDKVLAASHSGKIAQTLSVAAADSTNFTTALNDWLAWYGPRATAAVNPAWQTDRLEYRFSMSASVKEGRLTLTAPEHHGGRIDWDTFTASPFASAPAGATPAKAVVTALTAMPTLLQIPGMPSPWFWEVEDPTADAARIEAGPSDTARLLLIEAALAFTPDWFLLSLRLPVASLSTIDTLQITDTYGVTTIIRAADFVRPDPNFSLWKVTQGAAKLGYLLLPPPNISFLTSDPVEEVATLRDEAANLAWALHRIPATPAEVIPPATSGGGDWVYSPMTPLPDARVPLALMESAAGRFLVEAQMVNAPPNQPTALMPAGFQVRDEEIPDEGLTVRRRFEIGRTPDGVLRLWISRETAPGARMPASGVRFDSLDPGAATNSAA